LEGIIDGPKCGRSQRNRKPNSYPFETLKPQHHLCLIYESHKEWRAAVVPFISIGLRRGEKCAYIIDTSTAAEIRKYLAEEGVDVASVGISSPSIFFDWRR